MNFPRQNLNSRKIRGFLDTFLANPYIIYSISVWMRTYNLRNQLTREIRIRGCAFQKTSRWNPGRKNYNHVKAYESTP